MERNRRRGRIGPVWPDPGEFKGSLFHQNFGILGETIPVLADFRGGLVRPSLRSNQVGQQDSPSVLPSVRSVLEESVAENLQAFRKRRKGEEKSANHPTVFEHLLNNASALLYEALRQGLPLRVALKQENRA